MAENLDIFDFALSQSDMAKIEALDKKESAFFDKRSATSVKWSML